MSTETGPGDRAGGGRDRAGGGLEILPVRGIGEVHPGADLAGMIADAAPWLRDRDVLVVTSKIVSKAEGRLVAVPRSGPERDRARAAAIDGETARVVATRGETRIVATHHGFVMASAGVDASNVDPSYVVLLPKDPDASARALRAELARRYGLRVAVVVSDTSGRPWRNGLTDVALGAAGIEPLRDYRGQTDRYGNELRLTQVAVADQLAAAAELVKGKHDQIPVAVVRGLVGAGAGQDGPGVVATLVRDGAQDMFALGTAEARAAGLLEAAALPERSGPERSGPERSESERPDLARSGPGLSDPEPWDTAAVDRAVAVVTAAAAASTRMTVVRQPGGPVPASGQGPRTTETGRPGAPVTVRCETTDPADPASLVRLGADVHRLRAALAAAGLASAWRVAPPATVIVTVGSSPAGPPAGYRS